MNNDKELYAQKFQAQLDEWQAGIAKLKAQISGASADAQIELNKKSAELSAQYETTQTKFAEFTHASGEAIESIKTGLEAARDDLARAFDDARSKFKI